jgi:hypothetical protein
MSDRAQQIDEAAAWWTNALREVNREAHAAGDRFRGVAPPVTEEQFVAFREALRADLLAIWEAAREDAERSATALPWAVLDVDYDPRPPLLGALLEAGIACRGFMFSADGLLPRKTVMWVNFDGSTVVKLGYGAAHVALAKLDWPPSEQGT